MSNLIEYTYYGRMNFNKKPKSGVEQLMLDEHIASTVKKEKDKFRKDMQAMIDGFNKMVSGSLKSMEKRLSAMADIINSNHRYLGKVIALNELHMPKVAVPKLVKQKDGDKPSDSDEEE